MERLTWKFSLIRPLRGVATLRSFVFSLGLLLTATTASAVTFNAAIERDTISLGESVGFSLTFEGAQPDGTPNIPAIAGLQFAYNGPSSQFSFVNGQTTTKITHNYTITPRQVGDFTIPALSATLGNQMLTTQPVQLKVLKPGAPPPEALAAGTQPVFLKLQLPKTNIFLGEVITGEFQLYLREGVGAGQFQFTGTPTEGLTLGKMAELQHRRVQIGNSIYTVVPIAIVLAPIKTGPLTIGPVTASVVVEQPGSNNRRRDPFSLFGNVERRQVSLVAEEQGLQCQPLPSEGKPADFTGAVGSYTLTVSIGPTNVATGDPITVRVQISGRGALDGLTLPVQSAWGNFKTYPPTAKIETSDQLGLQGTKTFEEIISPENADIQELPPFTFSFFDPETKTYRTLTHPATKLTVRPGGNVVAPTIAATSKNTSSDAAPAQVDIVPIKQRLGTVTPRDRATGFTRTYVALNLAPALALFGFVVWRKRTDALTNNPRLRRQRAVAAAIQAGLDRLRTHATQNQSDTFFAELVRLLQEKLGAQLDLPASAITEAVIDEKLRPRGLPDSTLDDLHALFQACNLARYAPMKSSQELAAIIPKLEAALRKLDEVKA
jgi:hypothetical protein